MKKPIVSLLIATVVVSMAVPTFADNNGNGNGHSNGRGNSIRSGYLNTQQIKSKIESKFRIEFEGDDENESDDTTNDYLHSGLPFGLAKRSILPYGLAKRDNLPYGLDKKLFECQEDLSTLDVDALIEKGDALIALAEDTYDMYEDTDYTDELDALDEAIDALQDEIDALEALTEDDEVSTTAFVEAYEALTDAVAAFNDLEILDDAAVEALTAQIAEIEEVLNGLVYGEVQGAYPLDSDQALLDYIDEVEAAMEDGMTNAEYLTYTSDLEILLEAFLEMQYATAEEIETYNTAISDYQDEVTGWIDGGVVEDTDVSITSDAFLDYYKLVMLTISFDDEALVKAAELDAQVELIDTARTALLTEE